MMRRVYRKINETDRALASKIDAQYASASGPRPDPPAKRSRTNLFRQGQVGTAATSAQPSADDEDTKDAVDRELEAFAEIRKSPVQLPEDRKDGRDPLVGYFYDLPGFILLKLVACCVLGGMASEANIERVFSIMGKIITPQRSNLDADKVEAIIYVIQNRELLSLDELIAATKAVMFG